MTADSPALAAWALALGHGAGDLPTAEGLAEALEAHGIAAACAQAFHGSEAWRALDPALAARLRDAARSLAARELAWAAPLARVAAAFGHARLPWLVTKGEALARTLYPKPGTRERCDVDAWVRRDDFARAGALLESLGFAAQASATGFWSLPERAYAGPAGLVIDLHESLFSQPLLARVLEFDEVLARSRALPGLDARAPDDADALLIAVLHRVAHHAAERGRLIWLYDVDRLVRAGALDAAASRAVERGVAGLLVEALDASRAAFGTPLPDALRERLATLGSSERATRLLRPMSALRRRWFDFASVPGARARLAYLRELAFPDARYMSERYGAGSWRYLTRAVRGLAKALRG